jgi:hypothetical protein
MSYFVIGLLFIGYNRILSDPSCTLWPCRYSHTILTPPTRQLTGSFLISQQVIPYRTHGSTCCPGVSTPKIQSLADSSNHMSWRYQLSPPFHHLLKPQDWSSPWSLHIMIDGRPNTLTKTQDKLNIIKDGRLAWQLMTAGLSISTNHKPNSIGIQSTGNQIDAWKCVTRGGKHIGSTWSRNTRLALSLAIAQSLVLQDLEHFQSSQRLNNNDWKQAIQTINKTVPKY